MFELSLNVSNYSCTESKMRSSTNISLLWNLQLFFIQRQTSQLHIFEYQNTLKNCLPFRLNAKIPLQLLLENNKNCNSAELKLSKRESKDLNERVREDGNEKVSSCSICFLFQLIFFSYNLRVIVIGRRSERFV